MKKKINIVTLGCSKNIVDSELLMHQLSLGNWEVVHDSNDTSAKVVVINTCGFIGDAKEESVNTILDFVNAKKNGFVDKVYVMGCLSQRYKKDLMNEIPEVDGFYGVSDLPQILKELNTEHNHRALVERKLTTPSHYAYLKISEGCNWGCSYCAIPLIRGKHISRTIESLVEEATILAQKGVKELIVIAQDTTYYGVDIYGERKISELLNKLSKIDGIEWIRLHYAYPFGFPDELIEEIRSNPKVCKYLDIPLQHINSEVLRMMRRGIDRTDTVKLINKIRERIPDIAIRTTFLVGHPGETPEAFNELIDFIKAFRFDRVGVFEYSEEEDTFAAINYTDSIPAEEKQRRAEQLMAVQQEISFDLNREKIGKQFRVIVDRLEGDYFICRTENDSPEVDQEVLVKTSNIPSSGIAPGDFKEVIITDALEYDLYGEFI